MSRLGRLLLLLTTAAVLGGAGGCGPGTEPVVQCFGSAAWVQRAPADGTYALREACPSRPKPFQGPTVELRRDDPLGFRSEGPGLLEAIAGARRFPLPPGRDYVWLRQVSGTENAARAIGAVGMVAFAIIALPVEIPMLIINPIRC